jgi:hypothetical protein
MSEQSSQTQLQLADINENLTCIFSYPQDQKRKNTNKYTDLSTCPSKCSHQWHLDTCLLELNNTWTYSCKIMEHWLCEIHEITGHKICWSPNPITGTQRRRKSYCRGYNGNKWRRNACKCANCHVKKQAKPPATSKVELKLPDLIN